ncbi:MAG: histidine kinase [Bacteroidetes bacterium]|jgi:two-component system phosphate regulon sensor histidine kinase PhoR|nr:histidine kinase [Bacteroidota bacterium]
MTAAPSSFPDERPPVFSRVTLKTAATVAAAVLVLTLIVVEGPWHIRFLIAGGAGLATYASVWSFVTPRIQHAIRTLRRIRQHEFDNLEAAPRPTGDEMRELVWEVFRTGQKLEGEIQDLKRMENYRREFIGNVSHELKTPIFSVQGFTETLLDGAVDDSSVNRSFLKKIMRNVNRLDNLARDLSEIARIETGELEMSAEPFNLRSLVQGVVESLEIKAENKNVTLQHRLPENLPPVHGDRERIRQVLVNLCDNAIKYNREGGHVEIIGRLLPSNEVKVSVADDGLGVSPEHIPRLTERFYRVDKSRSRSQGGTGLGLAIVKHILSAHDRELMIESTPGSGSTFGFTLPAILDEEPSGRRPSIPAHTEGQRAS